MEEFEETTLTAGSPKLPTLTTLLGKNGFPLLEPSTHVSQCSSTHFPYHVRAADSAESERMLGVCLYANAAVSASVIGSDSNHY